MTRSDAADLRRWTLEPMTVEDSSPHWRGGLAMVVFVALALGAIDANNQRVEQSERADRAEVQARDAKAALEQINEAPQIRLVGRNFRCENFRIRDEWTLVVAKECERLGGLLVMARGAP
jgi:hypothetical protein